MSDEGTTIYRHEGNLGIWEFASCLYIVVLDMARTGVLSRFLPFMCKLFNCVLKSYEAGQFYRMMLI